MKLKELLETIIVVVIYFSIWFIVSTIAVYLIVSIHDRYNEYKDSRDSSSYTLEDWKICQISYLYRDTALTTNDRADIKLAVWVEVLLSWMDIDCTQDFQRSRQTYLLDSWKLNTESIKYK